MSFNHMSMPHSGAAAQASMGTLQHGRAMAGGHGAAQRLQMAAALGGGGGMGGSAMGQPQPDFRASVAQATGLPGVSPQEVHGAIAGLASAGHLSPLQAHALVAHQGPLHGPGGAQTVNKIAQAVKVRRPGGSAGGAPQAPQQQPRPMPQMNMPQPPMPGNIQRPQGAMPTMGSPVSGGGMPAGIG
jgi:hypothetical protein